MPTLPVQSFATTTQTIVSGIQGRAGKFLNFAIGSTLRAIAEGFTGIFLWFQAMVLQLLTATRLSTSVGIDVDTFTADFMPIIPGSQTAALPGGSPRLGAQASSGQVTLSRFTPGPSAPFIVVGAQFQTGDGKQVFQVIADPTFGTFVPTANGYSLAANVGSITVPVQNTVPGSAGNVAAGAISVILTSITGIDSVSNNANFTNGVDFEHDSALKARFAAYILGLSRGDIFGLTASILGVDPVVQWTLTEGYNYDGSYRPGFFFVVADDGSGNPSPSFMGLITNAANAVRPLGIQCGVFLPVIIPASVSMQITTAVGFDHNTVVAQVSAAIATNIDGLGLGNDLEFTILPGWAYAIAGVTKVTAVTLNGKTGDAATIVTSKKTLDGQNNIFYATVKAQSVIVS